MEKQVERPLEDVEANLIGRVGHGRDGRSVHGMPSRLNQCCDSQMAGVLPARYLPAYEKASVYGPFVLMAVILIPGFHKIFTVPALWLFETWMGVIGSFV